MSNAASRADQKPQVAAASKPLGPFSDAPELKLFQRLAVALIEGEPQPASEALAQRLWRLAQTVLSYTQSPANIEQQLQFSAPLHNSAARLIREQGLDDAVIDRLRNRCKAFDIGGLSLRAWSEHDVDLYARLLDDEQMWTHLPESYPNPVTRELATTLIDVANNATEHHLVWALREGDNPVGQVRAQWHDFADPSHSDNSRRVAEISYWIGREHWGTGLASRAVTRATRELFLAHPELEQLNARVAVGNKASCSVLEKSAYRDSGLIAGTRGLERTYRVFRTTYEPLL